MIEFPNSKLCFNGALIISAGLGISSNLKQVAIDTCIIGTQDKINLERAFANNAIGLIWNAGNQF